MREHEDNVPAGEQGPYTLDDSNSRRGRKRKSKLRRPPEWHAHHVVMIKAVKGNDLQAGIKAMRVLIELGWRPETDHYPLLLSLAATAPVNWEIVDEVGPSCALYPPQVLFAAFLH